MKRFFKLPGPQPQPNNRAATTKSPSPPPVVHTTGLQPKYVVPPVPHPNTYEHIAIVASKTGLLLRPHINGLVRTESHVKINWGLAGKIEEVEGDGERNADWSKAVIVYGIIGTLDLFSASHLLVISSRTEAGSFLAKDHIVYTIKGVTAIPLTEERASIVIKTLSSRNASGPRPSLILTGTEAPAEVSAVPIPGKQREGLTRVKFASQDDIKVMTPAQEYPGELELDNGDISPTSSGQSTPSSEISATSPIEKTLANRLSFWSRLSKRPANFNAPLTLSEDQEADVPGPPKQSLDSIIDDTNAGAAEVIESILEQTAPAPATKEERNSELEDKVVKECVREFSRGGMYFAYNFDITRSLQDKRNQIANLKRQNALLAELDVSKDDKNAVDDDKVDVLAEPSPTLPLWRRVERQFWWNEWMSKQFVDAGLHGYVLPVMQGFYQSSTFDIPREPMQGEIEDYTAVEYTIISRRSRDRAGLRYQRRGIGEEGHVANFVETESVMQVNREGTRNVFSYIQVRGSIPLYWSQSGYSLKPAPQLSSERTRDQNMDALSRHFQKTVGRYGPQYIVNLAEQHGKEGAITHAYGDHVKELNSPDIQYCEYDFHAETKGMKYENISKLVSKQERTFEHQGYLWVSDHNLMSEQKGVFRVNCIDCLDRTNVVQSAFARHILVRQLSAVALHNPEQPRTDSDVVLNDLWANNGDAISRAYAGTSALKGDFTRTGKRDLGGMLNDGMNSLARMYTSTFSDWFCQAVIDFMLGYRTISVFSEFLLRLQSTDPKDIIRLSRIRAEAIATSVSRVLVEGERLLSGWTVFSPVDLNTKMGHNFEEKIILLTWTALYIISYDYTLEKVKLYTRVPLADIVQITKGAYILSPLEEASQDPVQNAGFTISWLSSKQLTRITSYSVRNSLESPTAQPQSPSAGATPRSPTSSTASKLLAASAPFPGTESTFAAFKVLPIDPARSRRQTGSFIEPADEFTGAKTCKDAVDLMVDAIVRACRDAGSGHEDEFVVDADVVSLVEAKRNTSMYAKMEYGVKRLLWLGG